VACTLIKDSGVYRLERLPEGNFYLFGVGLRDATNGSVYFDYRHAMRAGGQRIRVSPNGFQGDTALELRPPSAFDPPLLLTLATQALPGNGNRTEVLPAAMQSAG